MDEMSAMARAEKLRLTLLEDLEKTEGDIPNSVRWLGDNAKQEIRQAEAAARRKALEAAESAARDATLPERYQWGDDAMEQFNFGKQRAAEAIRVLRALAESTET